MSRTLPRTLAQTARAITSSSASSSASACASSSRLSTLSTASTRPTRAAYAPAPALVRFAGGNPWVQRRRTEAAETASTGLRNDKIPYKTVQVADAEGVLGAPVQLLQVLRKVDTRTEAVVLVSTEPAVVRIVNLEEEKAKARDREVRSKISRRLAVEDKELQVGWTAAPPDLAHKLATAQATLAKGDRVHMVFAMRANSSGGARTYVANETKLAIVAQFDAGLKDLGKRWKPDEIANGLWVCYWQPLDTVNADARTKLQDAMSEKRKDKDDKKEARKLKEAERQRKAAERRAAEK